jgi:arsenate reductase
MNITANIVQDLSGISISEKRKMELMPLISYLKKQVASQKNSQLNFICTHNSRRSQFSQFWAKVMADHYEISCATFSGGVEVTACNERVIKTLKNQGFSVENNEDQENPRYLIGFKDHTYGVFFSKKYDHPENPNEDFAAIMTCGHADENCPFIPGADERIPIRYKDPKIFDETVNETQGYLDKSIEIASEMNYIFSQVGS